MAEGDVIRVNDTGHQELAPLETGDVPDLSAVYDVAGSATTAAAAVTASSLGALTQAQVLARGTGS